MITAKQVRMARSYYGINQTEFAHAIGCGKTALVDIENGRNISQEIEDKIIKYCFDLTFIYGGVVERSLIKSEEKLTVPVKFRPHRGSLEAAMNEVREFYSLAAFINWLADDLAFSQILVTQDKVRIQYYCYDERIKWDTYIVALDGYGVVGFTNGQLEK